MSISIAFFQNFLVLFWLLCIPSLCFPQGDFSFQHISTVNGLPSNSIRDFCEDSIGFIWIGTENGLVKYDGYSCIDVPKIVNDSIENRPFFRAERICCDHRGNIWVGTHDQGIYRSSKYSPYLESVDLSWISPSLNTAKILDMDVEDNGWVWLATAEKECYGFNLENKEFIDVGAKILSNKLVEHLGQIFAVKCETGTRKVWFFDENNNLLLLENKKKWSAFNFPNLKSRPVNASSRRILPISNNLIWLSGYGIGLIQFNPLDGSWEQLYGNVYGSLFSPFVVDIAYKDGLLYFSSYSNGIQIWNEHNKTLRAVGKEHQKFNLQSNTPQKIYFSKKHHLWIGDILFGVEVSYANKVVMETFSPHPQLEDKVIYSSILSLYPKNDSILFVGTDGLGLFEYHYQNKSFNPVDWGPFPPKKVIKSITKYKNKFLFGHWIDGYSTLDENGNWSNIVGDRLNPNLRILGEHAWAFAEDKKDKTLWIGFLNEGLAKVDSTGRMLDFYLKNEENGYIPNDILDVVSDKDGTIWVVTGQSGLGIKKRNEKKFTWIRSNKELGKKTIPHNQLRCIFEDSQHTIWIGTIGNGLLAYKNGYFHQYSMEDGLIANDIQAITESQDSVLFVSSFRGITKIKVNGEVILQTARYSTKGDNVLNHKAILYSKFNKLYVGGQKGLTVMLPNANTVGEQGPNVFFSSLKLPLRIDKKTVKKINSSFYQENSIKIDKQYAFFSIELASENFANIEQNEYAYRIASISKNWTYLYNGNRTLNLHGLKPGNYKLEVKCREGLSKWGNTRIVDVHISEQFWKSDLFLFLIVLLFLIGLASALLLSLRQKNIGIRQKLLELEREKLFQEKIVLKDEVQSKTAEIIAKTAQVAHKTEMLSDIKSQLSDLSRTSESDRASKLRGLSRLLETELSDETEWNQFRMYFDQANHDFSIHLQKKHPELTQNDIRMSLLIHLSLDTHDIAKLLNISVSGVRKARYRLKKRLELDKEIELYDYIRLFGQADESKKKD